MPGTSCKRWAVIVAVGLLAGPAGALSQEGPRPVAAVSTSGAEVSFQPLVSRYESMALTVTGPQGFVFQREFGAGAPPSFSTFDAAGEYLPDGVYNWELSVVPLVSGAIGKALASARASGYEPSELELRRLGLPPAESLVQSGHFRIQGGGIVDGRGVEPSPGPGARKQSSESPLQSPSLEPPTPKDWVIADDLIVDGSACIGFDCVNGESFGFDTIRLKENNLRIKAQDTSSSAGFPTNDWQITFNDSASGGQNKFSIDDIDGSRTPFTIVAGAPSHSLFVNASGRLGIRTSTPVVDVHVRNGNTPTLRLEQDGSSGFAPQTWDVAGNEANFFIRDVTGGSKLPIRIRPGAPTSAIDIAASGDIGMGTSSPAFDLHVSHTGGVIEQLQSTDNGAIQLRMKSNSVNRRLIAENQSGVVQSQIQFGDGGAFTFAGTTTPGNDVMRIDSSGNVVITGNCSDAPGGGGCTADYVFEPGYELMPLAELAEFVAEKKHLPNVPPADVTRKNGLNLSAMNGRLLEKIEELTLYAIAQHDTIQKLEARLQALEQKSE